MYLVNNMKQLLFLILAIGMLSACGGSSGPENPGGKIPLGSGTTIPILKTEKARKAKLTFDLTEVIRKDDKLDFVIMITNRGEEAMLYFEKEELSITDNDGYITKVSEAKIAKVRQFGSGVSIASIPEDGKVKSIISFEGVREEAESCTLFFKGETNRGKNASFRTEFKKVNLRE